MGEDFCFQLNSKELKNLTSQNVISNYGEKDITHMSIRNSILFEIERTEHGFGIKRNTSCSAFFFKCFSLIITKLF